MVLGNNVPAVRLRARGNGALAKVVPATLADGVKVRPAMYAKVVRAAPDVVRRLAGAKPACSRGVAVYRKAKFANTPYPSVRPRRQLGSRQGLRLVRLTDTRRHDIYCLL